MHRSNNIVVKTLSGVNYYELLATCSKYSIDVSDILRKASEVTTLRRYTNLFIIIIIIILSNRQYGMCSFTL